MLYLIYLVKWIFYYMWESEYNMYGDEIKNFLDL